MMLPHPSCDVGIGHASFSRNVRPGPGSVKLQRLQRLNRSRWLSLSPARFRAVCPTSAIDQKMRIASQQNELWQIMSNLFKPYDISGKSKLQTKQTNVDECRIMHHSKTPASSIGCIGRCLEKLLQLLQKGPQENPKATCSMPNLGC